MRAEPVRASVALVALDAPVQQLAGDRRLVSPEVLRDPRDGPSASGQELDPVPFLQFHLFHFCFSLVVARPEAGSTRSRPLVGRRDSTKGMRQSGSKRGFPFRKGRGI